MSFFTADTQEIPTVDPNTFWSHCGDSWDNIAEAAEEVGQTEVTEFYDFIGDAALYAQMLLFYED